MTDAMKLRPEEHQMLLAAARESGQPAVMRSCVGPRICGQSIDAIVHALEDGTCPSCGEFTVHPDGKETFRSGNVVVLRP